MIRNARASVIGENRTTGSIVGGNLHREENHDHTESQVREPRAYRGAVWRVHIGLTAPAWTGFDEALAAYQRGDYSRH